MIFSNVIIILLCKVKHFYSSCLANTTNDDQSQVNTEKTFGVPSSNSMVGKYRTVASLNILWKDNYILLSKSSRNNCYRSFSPFFTNHIKVHSRRYMICRKVACPGSKILPTIVAGALACENRPHRWQESPRITAWCLNKSTIQTQNLLSIRCLQLVLVRVSTWRSCMIGVVLIFQSLCQ